MKPRVRSGHVGALRLTDTYGHTLLEMTIAMALGLT